MRFILKLTAVLLAIVLSTVALIATSAANTRIEATPGAYVMDPTHASLHWKVKHMGLSNYTARFKKFDVALNFDPNDISKSTVRAVVDMSSVETDFVPQGGRDFNAELKSEPFFNIGRYKEAVFTSKKVTSTGPDTMRVEGDLVFLGQARPVTLDVKLNGSMASHPFVKVPAVGFSAKGTIKRSNFGLNPPPIQQGVGDEVELEIEAEFVKKT